MLYFCLSVWSASIFIKRSHKTGGTIIEYIQLGNSNWKISRIFLECMEFEDADNGQYGCTIDQEHTREVVKKHFKSVHLNTTIL